LAAAAGVAGPSSFQDAPVKRGAPVGLLVALGLLVVVVIAAAAVVLPSFLAKPPAPVAVAAPANTIPAVALTTTPAPPPPTPALITEPTANTPGPAPMASDAPPAIPAAAPRLRHLAPAADAPEDPDLDPETHPARGRHRGGESADVPY